jgi:hypothetical protein
VTKTLSLLFFSAVAGTAVASTGTNTAPMAVSVTIVRSCLVDTHVDSVPVVRLKCTSGAQSTVKVSETVHPTSTALVNEGSKTLTLNF